MGFPYCPRGTWIRRSAGSGWEGEITLCGRRSQHMAPLRPVPDPLGLSGQE